MDPSTRTDEAAALDHDSSGQQNPLAAVTADYAAAPVADPRTPEEIIGFDAAGAPA